MNNIIEGCLKYGDPYDLTISATGTTGNIFSKNWGVKTSGWLSESALPVYANNGAAVSAGLAVGRLYQTSTGVLMIVY
jgi:hypothetical protein